MARPLHDVGHRQEIGLEAELRDQRELMLDRLAHRRQLTRRKTSLHARLGQCAQPAGRAVAGRHDLLGVLVAQFGERERAARCDRQRRGQPLARIQRGQASTRSQMGLGIGLERQPAVGHRQVQACGRQQVLQRLARARVHQHIAASHQRQADQLGHPRQPLEPQRVVRPVQQFDGDGAAISPEPGLEPHRVGEQGLEGLHGLGQQNRKTARQAGQVRRVGHPAFQVGRLRQVLTLGRAAPGHADPLRQVAVAATVLRQQHQAWTGLPGEHRRGRRCAAAG